MSGLHATDERVANAIAVGVSASNLLRSRSQNALHHEVPRGVHEEPLKVENIENFFLRVSLHVFDDFDEPREIEVVPMGSLRDVVPRL